MRDAVGVFILGDDDHTVGNLSRIFEKASGIVIQGSSLMGVAFDPGNADVIVAQTRNPDLLPSLTQRKVPTLLVLPRTTIGIAAAEAVLPFDSDPCQIRAAAVAIAAGLRVHAPSGNIPQDDEIAFLDPLTERELSVLNVMAEGYSNPEIARQLGISRNTVKFHVSSIISKLGAASRTEAVAIGLKRGLIIV